MPLFPQLVSHLRQYCVLWVNVYTHLGVSFFLSLTPTTTVHSSMHPLIIRLLLIVLCWDIPLSKLKVFFSRFNLFLFLVFVHYFIDWTSGLEVSALADFYAFKLKAAILTNHSFLNSPLIITKNLVKLWFNKDNSILNAV